MLEASNLHIKPITLVFTTILLFSFGVLIQNVFADQVITTIPIQGVPIGLGVNPTTNMIYVGTSYDPSHSDRVYVIDGKTNNVTSIIQGGQGHRDIGVNPNTNMIYVVNYGYFSTSFHLVCDNTISVINGTTNSVQNIIPIGNSPNGIGVDLNTNMIYVTNFGNMVLVIDGATNSVQGTIPVGNLPNGIGVNQNTNMIYVANSNDNTISVIDGTTNLVQNTIFVGKVPFAVGVNPNTDKIYVGNAVNNTISVINGITNSVQSTLSVNNPWDIGVDSNTNTIYVTDNAGHTVSVIDGSPIQSPILETRDIINIINNMTLTHGTTNSLDSKLDTAISYLNANDNPNAKSVLQSFLNEVNAQTGKKITTDQANQLVTAAQNVIKSIP